ncbi:hypothetical protein RJ640_015816 [Escallonia rubra]|uniref:Reverse transcriptase Ty1/copia-type domain-containing protein n=1 Tax=Escallonia rubra TaxID=112253 RepID=A0AA88S4F2_9ASTE|nr:hypothetical protein RJ640_015816 [Escallonia rubra]
MRSSNTNLDGEEEEISHGSALPEAHHWQRRLPSLNASTSFPNHNPAHQPWSRTVGDTAPPLTVAQQFAATSYVSMSFPSFTPSEMQRLTDLLGCESGPTNGHSASLASQNISDNLDSWIIDTGATDIYHVKLIIPSVQIPNGDTVLVHALGQVSTESTQTSGVPIRSVSPTPLTLKPYPMTLDQAPGLTELPPSTIPSPISIKQSALPTNEPPIVPSKRTSHVSKNFSGYNYTLPLSLAPPSSTSHSSSLSANSTGVKHAHWRDAMAKEISVLEANNTWMLVPLQSKKRAIDSKWVYKVKFHTYDTMERYKSWLVAKGYTQIEGLDFHETFALVAKLAMVSHNWYHKFTQSFLAASFDQSKSDHSLFTFTHQGSFLAALIYVDDVINTGIDSTKISWVKHSLYSKFHIKDFGKLKYF